MDSNEKISKKIFMEISLLILISLLCYLITEKGKNFEPFLQIQDKEFVLQKDRDEKGKLMNINIKYPKVTGSEDLELDEVNRLIENAAFAPLCAGETVENTVAVLEKESIHRSISYVVEYKLLYLGEDYISLAFHMFTCAGGPSSVQDYVVTVNMKNGEYIHFSDYADIVKVIPIMRDGDFLVYKGTCNDVTDEEIHKSEICSRLTTIFREKIRTTEMNGDFDCYSSQNIGLDEEYLYIYISVPDQSVVPSFHGYFILCIPLESIAVLEKSDQPEDGTAQQGKEYEMYQILNADLLGKGFLERVEDILDQKEAMEYAQKEKKVFSPQTDQNSSYPEKLVAMLEEAFYNSDISNMEEEIPYQNVIQEMGSEEFLLDMEDLYFLFPQIEVYREELYSQESAFHYMQKLYGTPFHCKYVFRVFLTEEQENYIFVCKNGREKMELIVTERIEDKFETINEFDIHCSEEGRVVCYEDEFYYIFPYRTFNQKDCDGVGICRLMDNPTKEIFSIWYLPYTFDMEQIYTSNEILEVEEKMDTYMEQVKKDIMSGNYLDNGVYSDGMEVYMGDEKMSEYATLKVRTQFPYVESNVEPEHDGIAYQMDIANCGLPVYVWREYALSYINGKPEYMRICFYFYDSLTDSYEELSQLSMDEREENNSMGLVQMWFKKIEGKVYTFQICYDSDYNYILSVSLLERNQLKVIRIYLLSPRKEFIVEETN